MRVLIITYYWPPAGGSGVQRWLKFVKYLPSFGIEPIVYCPKNPSYPLVDASFVKEIPKDIEVLKQPIIEPNQFLGFKKKKQSNNFLASKPSFLNRCLQYVRANFFIPDARKFWIQPSAKFLQNYLTKNPVKLIITTGPPHSAHLIGLQLSKKLEVKWLTDFRDPWTDIFYNETLSLSQRARKKNALLEKRVIENCDAIITVSNQLKKELRKHSKSIAIIPNGYDDDLNDFTPVLDTKFSISHIGTLPTESDSVAFWKGISELCVEIDGFKEDLEIKLIGNVNPETLKNIQTYNFKECLKIEGYQAHGVVSKYQQKSQVLLLLIPNAKSAKAIVTGKLFEYLKAQRPILAIGPEDGDAAAIINKTNAGVCIDFDKKDAMKHHVLSLYKQYKNGSLTVNTTHIKQYHRKELTRQLVSVIKETIEK